MEQWVRLFERIRIVVDTRERAPQRFRHPTVSGALPAGDYSIWAFEDRVAIERKSVDDLVGCLKGQGRVRFERALQRSRGLDYFGLILEGTLSTLLPGQYQSEMSPPSVIQ